MRVLTIVHDAAFAASLECILRAASMVGHKVDEEEEGIDLAKRYDYDLILLDLDWPGLRGYQILRVLRLAKVQAPLIGLSVSGEVESKVRAFGFGADDYLVRPFHSDELVARMRAMVRRMRRCACPIVTVGQLAINLEARTLEVEGRRIPLTRKEWGIIELLTLRRGMAVPHTTILDHLYGGFDEPQRKIIEVFVYKLRKKIGTGAAEVIQTARGRGYMLAA